MASSGWAKPSWYDRHSSSAGFGELSNEAICFLSAAFETSPVYLIPTDMPHVPTQPMRLGGPLQLPAVPLPAARALERPAAGKLGAAELEHMLVTAAAGHLPEAELASLSAYPVAFPRGAFCRSQMRLPVKALFEDVAPPPATAAGLATELNAASRKDKKAGTGKATSIVPSWRKVGARMQAAVRSTASAAGTGVYLPRN